MNACYPIVIRSDHKLLEYFKLPQRLSQRQARWHHTLAHYQFKIEYKKGDLNHIANMLSCNPGHRYDKQFKWFQHYHSSSQHFFHGNKSLATLRDRILDTQTYDLFSQWKLLEIEQATSSFKTGCFTANDNSLYFRNLLCVPPNHWEKKYWLLATIMSCWATWVLRVHSC